MGNKHSRSERKDKRSPAASNPSTTASSSSSRRTNPPSPPMVVVAKPAGAGASSRPTTGARRQPKTTVISGAMSDVFQHYSVERKELGHGHYGVVRVGTHRETGKKVAVKTILKAKVSRPETLKREINILKTVDHPNIIKLFDVYEDARNLHLVTELCTGGELFDRIIARGHYTEADAAVLVRKLIGAIKYCHDREICHRDLKPENFLFETTAEDAELKVIDFGLSRVDDGGGNATVMTTRVGTPYYIAPEVLGRHYDKSCDLWSIGVITYILLSGYPPFYGDSDPEIFAAIRSGKYSYDTPEWDNITPEAKDFIDHLLRMRPSERLTADQSLEHPWLRLAQEKQTAIDGASSSAGTNLLSTGIMASLKRFTGHNKLKKAALGVIADQLTEHEIDALKKEFEKIDNDGDGVITVDELAIAVHNLNSSMNDTNKEKGLLIESDVRSILDGIDIDGNGKVDYKEFITATMKRNMFNQEMYLQNAFNHFDKQGQGVISKQDLVEFMGSEEHAQEIMDEVDTNGDGEISFEEFCHMMEVKGFGESGANTPKGSSQPDGTIFNFQNQTQDL